MITASAGQGVVVSLILAQERRLRRLAFRLTRCEADADDLVQDTLMAALIDCEQLQCESSVGPWVRTIMRRTQIRGLRKLRRRRAALDTELDSVLGGPINSMVVQDERMEPSWSVEGFLAFTETLDDEVSRALSEIPWVYSQAFYGAVVCGMSYAETARFLGIPEGTVASRVHRAHEYLKTLLCRDNRCPNP